MTSIDEPVKRRESQTWPASKPYKAEDIWTSSRRDMDNREVHSLRSISSISALNPARDTHGPGNMSQEFINHGFLLWNQTRQQWVGKKRKSKNQGQQLREPRLSWNATYDSLLGSNKPFLKPVPLSEMVDFLVDAWEEERDV